MMYMQIINKDKSTFENARTVVAAGPSTDQPPQFSENILPVHDSAMDQPNADFHCLSVEECHDILKNNQQR